MGLGLSVVQIYKLSLIYRNFTSLIQELRGSHISLFRILCTGFFLSYFVSELVEVVPYSKILNLFGLSFFW